MLAEDVEVRVICGRGGAREGNPSTIHPCTEWVNGDDEMSESSAHSVPGPFVRSC